jgi:hypothetical protein
MPISGVRKYDRTEPDNNSREDTLESNSVESHLPACLAEIEDALSGKTMLPRGKELHRGALRSIFAASAMIARWRWLKRSVDRCQALHGSAGPGMARMPAIGVIALTPSIKSISRSGAGMTERCRPRSAISTRAVLWCPISWAPASCCCGGTHPGSEGGHAFERLAMTVVSMLWACEPGYASRLPWCYAPTRASSGMSRGWVKDDLVRGGLSPRGTLDLRGGGT